MNRPVAAARPARVYNKSAAAVRNRRQSVADDATKLWQHSKDDPEYFPSNAGLNRGIPDIVAGCRRSVRLQSNNENRVKRWIDEIEDDDDLSVWPKSVLNTLENCDVGKKCAKRRSRKLSGPCKINGDRCPMSPKRSKSTSKVPEGTATDADDTFVCVDVGKNNSKADSNMNDAKPPNKPSLKMKLQKVTRKGASNSGDAKTFAEQCTVTKNQISLPKAHVQNEYNKAVLKRKRQTCRKQFRHKDITLYKLGGGQEKCTTQKTQAISKIFTRTYSDSSQAEKVACNGNKHDANEDQFTVSDKKTSLNMAYTTNTNREPGENAHVNNKRGGTVNDTAVPTNDECNLQIQETSSDSSTYGANEQQTASQIGKHNLPIRIPERRCSIAEPLKLAPVTNRAHKSYTEPQTKLVDPVVLVAALSEPSPRQRLNNNTIKNVKAATTNNHSTKNDATINDNTERYRKIDQHVRSSSSSIKDYSTVASARNMPTLEDVGEQMTSNDPVSQNADDDSKTKQASKRKTVFQNKPSKKSKPNNYFQDKVDHFRPPFPDYNRTPIDPSSMGRFPPVPHYYQFPFPISYSQIPLAHYPTNIPFIPNYDIYNLQKNYQCVSPQQATSYHLTNNVADKTPPPSNTESVPLALTKSASRPENHEPVVDKAMPQKDPANSAVSVVNVDVGNREPASSEEASDRPNPMPPVEITANRTSCDASSNNNKDVVCKEEPIEIIDITGDDDFLSDKELIKYLHAIRIIVDNLLDKRPKGISDDEKRELRQRLAETAINSTNKVDKPVKDETDKGKSETTTSLVESSSKNKGKQRSGIDDFNITNLLHHNCSSTSTQTADGDDVLNLSTKSSPAKRVDQPVTSTTGNPSRMASDSRPIVRKSPPVDTNSREHSGGPEQSKRPIIESADAQCVARYIEQLQKLSDMIHQINSKPKQSQQESVTTKQSETSATSSSTHDVPDSRHRIPNDLVANNKSPQVCQQSVEPTERPSFTAGGYGQKTGNLATSTGHSPAVSGSTATEPNPSRFYRSFENVEYPLNLKCTNNNDRPTVPPSSFDVSKLIDPKAYHLNNDEIVRLQNSLTKQSKTKQKQRSKSPPKINGAVLPNAQQTPNSPDCQISTTGGSQMQRHLPREVPNAKKKTLHIIQDISLPNIRTKTTNNGPQYKPYESNFAKSHSALSRQCGMPPNYNLATSSFQLAPQPFNNIKVPPPPTTNLQHGPRRRTSVESNPYFYNTFAMMANVAAKSKGVPQQVKSVNDTISSIIPVLQKSEVLSPEEYVAEMNMLESYKCPRLFLDFYSYVTKMQIFSNKLPISFRIFMEFQNAGKLKQFEEGFKIYSDKREKEKVAE